MTSGYEAFAERLTARGVVTDAWYDGAPRFRREPEVLTEARLGELEGAAESLAQLFDELVVLVQEDPGLLEDFLGLTPVQRALWECSCPLWHGIARADLFETAEGLVTTELNSDTPTGSPEAVELGALALEDAPSLRDPNGQLGERFVEMVEAAVRALVEGKAPRRVGIVYPTELPEDLSLVRLYRKWLVAAGWEVVLGSPFNLDRDGSGRATLFERPLGLVLRHYKADWWTERASPWTDETLPETDPLVEPLQALLGASVERKTAVLNPFGSVVTQNKRSLALCWEHLHRFGAGSQRVIEKLVPYTSRLESLHPEQLRAQREQWVLKSDYGAEGDEVVLGPLVTQAEWEKALRLARPGRWVAQRYFEALASADGEQRNYGVFLVAGRAAGVYLRQHKGPTGPSALSVPCMLAPR